MLYCYITLSKKGLQETNNITYYCYSCAIQKSKCCYRRLVSVCHIQPP